MSQSNKGGGIMNCFALFDTHNNPKATKFGNWLELQSMASSPSTIHKTKCSCIASQLTGVKTKEAVLSHNQMTMLWIDVDSDDIELDELKKKIAMLGVSSVIYSTSTSMRLKNGEIQGKRWRVLIQLKEPIDCNRWIEIQKALISLFNADPCADRVAQILYAPNNPNVCDPGETRHYEYAIIDGERLDINALPELIQEEINKPKKEKQAFDNFKPKKYLSLKKGQISPIQAFNEQNTIEEILLLRGDTKQGNKWLYSGSKSGVPGISIKDNKMYAHGSSDPLSDGNAHDCFDVFMEINGFSFYEMVQHAAKNTTAPDGQTIDQHNKANLKQDTTILSSPKIPRENILNDSWMSDFMMSDKEMDKIAHPTFLYDNLIIQGHLIAIPAPPNGGKTTILMHIAGQIAKDISVVYINADVGGGDAKHYYKQAKETGIKLLLPDMKVGQSMNNIVEILEQMNQVDRDYSNYLYIFDTLKKMTDVINKNKAKELYKTLRGLSAKGMTIVLLAHTNKYKGDDGELIYEGTGDLRADVDELIYFIPQHHDDKSMTVSTKPDKVRGEFEPVTFNVSSTREVSLSDGYIDTFKLSKWDKQKDKDSHIIDAIIECLDDGINSQMAIVDYCKNKYDIGWRTTKRVLKYFSEGDKRLWNAEKGFQKNRINYSKVQMPDISGLMEKIQNDNFLQ